MKGYSQSQKMTGKYTMKILTSIRSIVCMSTTIGLEQVVFSKCYFYLKKDKVVIPRKPKQEEEKFDWDY
jgi:hypothetical protein